MGRGTVGVLVVIQVVIQIQHDLLTRACRPLIYPAADPIPRPLRSVKPTVVKVDGIGSRDGREGRLGRPSSCVDFLHTKRVCLIGSLIDPILLSGSAVTVIQDLLPTL